MSANNQILVKEHKGKWYVFNNIMAESWGKVNQLNISRADGVYGSRDEAYEAAIDMNEKEEWPGIEYGVQFNRLCKDDAEVELVGDIN